MKYILTEEGKKKIACYINNFAKNRNKILSANQDTANNTSLPTEEEIVFDLNHGEGVNRRGTYFAGWRITDHVEMVVLLKIDEDFVVENIKKEEENMTYGLDICDIAYELYKQEWIEEHTTKQVRMDTLRLYEKYQKDNIETSYAYESWDEFIQDEGYAGELYADYEVFVENEYMNKTYMHELLKDKELIAMYDDDIRKHKNINDLETIIFRITDIHDNQCRIVTNDCRTAYRKIATGACLCSLDILLQEMEHITKEVDKIGSKAVFVYN